jgi:hypothetical protein
MSVSFSAKVAVGVKLGRVWDVRTITEEVQKFDQDTGKPYMATKSKKVTYFCGKPTEFEYSIHEHEGDLGLDICVDNHEGDEDEWILGKEVYSCKCDGYRDEKSIREVKHEDIEAAKNEVAEKLAKHGYTGPIGVFLISYVSY